MHTRTAFYLGLVVLIAEASWSDTVDAGHRRWRRQCCTPAACCSTCSTAMSMSAMPMSVPAMMAPAPMPVQKSLYDRLGGEPAITAVVDEFVVRAAGNPKVNFTRAGTASEWKVTDASVARLKKHLVQLVCAVSGGPQKYEGRDMKSVHANMAVTSAEFDALAGDLIGALKKFNVPQPEIDDLIKIVAGTRPDIVEKP